MPTLRPTPMIALAGLALALTVGARARPDGSSTAPAAASPTAPAQAPAADAPKPESRPAPAVTPKKPTGTKGGAKAKGKDATEPDVLRGPSTDDGTVPGAAGTFGAPDDPLARARARAQAESFNRAIRTLMAPTAPESIRLSPQQVETVNAAEREFRITEEKFRRDHAEELRALRDVRPTRPGAGAGSGSGAQPPKPRPTPTNPGAPSRDDTPPTDTMTAPAAKPGAAPPAQDERAALMERLRKLEDKRPDPAPFQAKVWGALTDAQREALKNEMDRIADEMLERRDAQRRAQPTPAPGTPGDPNAAGKPGAPGTPGAPPKPGAPGNSSGKSNPSAASPPKPPAKPTAPPADAKGKEKGAKP